MSDEETRERAWPYTPPTRTPRGLGPYDPSWLKENLRKQDWQAYVDGYSMAPAPLADHIQVLLEDLTAGRLPETDDAERQAVLSILSNTVLTHFWVDRHGLAFALDATLRRRLLIEERQWQNGGSQYFVRYRSSADGAARYDYEATWWQSLGTVAAEATDAEYTTFRAACEQARAHAPIEVRVQIGSYLPWEHDWHVADSADAAAAGLHGVEVHACRASTDPNLVIPTVNRHLDAGRTDLLLHGCEVAGALGAPGLPLLARIVGTSNDQYVLETAVRAVIQIDHRDGDNVLARGIEKKHCRSLCRGGLLAHPTRAIEALADSGSRIETSEGVALLMYLRRRHPGELANPAVNPPDAPVDSIPKVLSDPPWRGKRSRPETAVVEGLQIVARPAGVVWEPGERNALRREIQSADWWRKQVADNEITLSTIPTHCPDADLLAIWNDPSKIKISRQAKRFIPFTLLKILARTDLAGLPGFLDYGRQHSSKGVFEVLAKIRDPRIAPLMAHAHFSAKAAGKTARSWMTAYPEETAIGLIPAAVGPAGTEREAAASALRFLTHGHRDAVRAAALEYGVSAIIESVTADALYELPKKVKKLPDFWSASSVTRPLLAGRTHALPEPAVTALAEMLSFTDLAFPYAGIELVRQACDPQSLAEFSWDLFQLWRAVGAPSKHGWAMAALGHFGDDEVARKLAALIRKWPGEGGHKRALKGLDILAAIGTDIALMHLHGISLKLKFKALKKAAGAKIAQVAEDRGFTPEELADRLVPDLDLDNAGSMVLDFGPRTFTVGFDESLQPVVRDASGKRLKRLPKPGASDDAELAKGATSRWKALRKNAKALSRDQILRFEQAMCTRRRWDVATWRTFMLEHPFLIHVVRRLIWATYVDGEVTATFRVGEDRTFTDARDEACPLADDAQIGIPHVLELDADILDSWGEILGNYEILQPFAQLGRDTYAPTDAERRTNLLGRVKGVTVPVGKVIGLDRRGWRHGEPQDAGWVYWYDKVLPGGNQASLALESGVNIGTLADSGDQQLGDVELQAGNFGDLDPILFSELARELDHLAT